MRCAADQRLAGAVCRHAGSGRTTWRAANEDAADALVDAAETAGLDETGLRLETGLKRIDRKEKEVDRQAGEGTTLLQV